MMVEVGVKWADVIIRFPSCPCTGMDVVFLLDKGIRGPGEPEQPVFCTSNVALWPRCRSGRASMACPQEQWASSILGSLDGCCPSE